MPDIKGPFEVYQTYDGEFQIIDATTRTVLDDVYAYDDSDADKETRVANIARALSICYGAKPDPDAVRMRELFIETMDIAYRLATDSHARTPKLLRRLVAIADEANIHTSHTMTPRRQKTGREGA